MFRGLKGAHNSFNFLHGSAIEVVVMASFPSGLEVINMLNDVVLLKEEILADGSADKSCEQNVFHVNRIINQ